MAVDLDTLYRALEQAGPASLGVSFLAGLFFSVNPVALAALPVSLAYVTKARRPGEAFGFGAMFILGLVVTHFVLGLAAGLAGQGVQALVGRYWGLVLGPLLIGLGLLWPGWIRLPLPAPAFRASRATGLWGAFALGAPFTVAVCPGCTPALVVLLGAASATGSPMQGAGLLLAFAIGRAIPIGAGAWAIGWLEQLKRLAPYRRMFETVGGLVFVLAGLYLLNAYFFVIPALAA
jgi:cytochrome c-type biogenesis protein